MKLFYSATSPYVRKVLVCAILRDIDQRIERVPTNPHESPAALIAENPLSKIPCLLTDDGFALFDSPVICEYLDQLGDALPLSPQTGAARWVALRLQAVGDGILDAAVARRMESAKPLDSARETFIVRQKQVVHRALALLERESLGALADIGAVSVACALGYLDFRFGAENWRPDHPRLADWFAPIAELPTMINTAPPSG
jgi:glutathione S-transferase